MVFLYHRICSSEARLSWGYSTTACALQGPDMVGQAHMEKPPLAIRSMTDTHDHPEANQLGVKVEIGMIFMQDLPRMRLELNNGTSYTINAHIFLKT